MMTPLGNALPETARTARRFAPGTFDAEDKMMPIVERPLGYQWRSCERALRQFGAKFLLSRLPLFWQIEPLLDEACRKVGVTVFHNEAENMPVGGAAIRSANIDTVLTTSEDAEAFVAYLFDKAVPIPKNWLLIHAGSARDVPAKLREPSFSVIAEVHEYPGFPKV